MAYAVAAGAMIGAYGAKVQGQQTADLLNYQAKIQDRNSFEALSAAKFNADKQGMMAQKVIGQGIANAGASGIEQTGGSILDIIGASAANAELDRQNIIHGGEIRSVNYQNQASMDRLGASKAVNASYFNALASMFGGGGKIAAMSGSGGNTEVAGMDMGKGKGQYNGYVGDYDMTNGGGDVTSAGSMLA